MASNGEYRRALGRAFTSREEFVREQAEHLNTELIARGVRGLVAVPRLSNITWRAVGKAGATNAPAMKEISPAEAIEVAGAFGVDLLTVLTYTPYSFYCRHIINEHREDY